MEAMVAKCLEEFGRIDILVNGAGINIRGPIDEVSYEEFAEVQRINVDGTWLACRGVAAMKEKQYGRIINLASALGLVAIANRTYCMRRRGNAHPFIGHRTGRGRHHRQRYLPQPVSYADERAHCGYGRGQEIHRGRYRAQALGDLKEIQGAAIYLASDAASYTTGAMLSVDGGWTAQWHPLPPPA